MFIVQGGEWGAGGGHPKVIPGAISLSTGGSVPFLFLFPFILLNIILLKYQVLLLSFFFFFSWGARVPVGPKAIEEKRLEEPGSD